MRLNINNYPTIITIPKVPVITSNQQPPPDLSRVLTTSSHLQKLLGGPRTQFTTVAPCISGQRETPSSSTLSTQEPRKGNQKRSDVRPTRKSSPASSWTFPDCNV